MRKISHIAIALCTLLPASIATADIFRLTDSASDYLSFPERETGALTGAEFIRNTNGMTLKQREEKIMSELRSGNLPEHLRTMVPVHTKHYSHRLKRDVNATFYVMVDYLAIGSDDDFVRMPTNLHTARALANEFGFGLPTRKMVDVIYNQAINKLKPNPLPPTRAMVGNGYFVKSHNLIEEQFGESNRGLLVAGHKKDVVITNKMLAKPSSIAIYGWHRTNGKAIQPLSTVHGARYVDYSHGIRMVSRTIMVEGTRMDIADVLANPDLCGLLSDEGVISQYDHLMRLKDGSQTTVAQSK